MKTWKIVFVAVIISVIGFGVFPLRKSIETLKVKNQELAEKKEKKSAEFEEYIGQKNEQGGVSIFDPEKAIPAKLSQTELLIDLQKIASKTNIELPNSWSFSMTEDAELNITKLGVSFPIKGDKGSIYKFIQAIEGNERFLEITKFGVRSFYENNIPLSEMMVNLQALSQEKINE